MKKKVTLAVVVAILVFGLMSWGAFGISHAQEAPVTITFAHIYSDERDVRRETIDQIAAGFMAEHPDVIVNIESNTDNYADVFEGALRAAEQGTAPDVVQIEDTLRQIAVDSQYFIKIGDYASEEQLATIPDIITPMRNYYNLDEEIWGLPWNASNPVMYYNPDMFEAAGLDPDNPPQTFDDISAACEAIMSAGIESLEGCINWPITSWLPEQWLSMQNALFVNNDNGHSGRATEALIDSPEMLRVMTWWKDLADKGYFVYSGSTEAYPSEGLLFVSGKTAIHLSTSAGISNVMNFAPIMGTFTPRVAQLPRPDADAANGITPGGGSIWVMAGHSDGQTQAAVDFAFYLISTENDMRWHKASGYFPIRQSSIDALTQEGWFDENPAYRIPLDQLLASESNVANAGSVLGSASQVRSAVVDAILSIIDGGQDPAEALAAAKQRADQAIADYNSVIGE